MKSSRLLDKDNIYLFHQGTNYRAYNFMGAHMDVDKKLKGVRFNVWAPNAAAVSIVGEFNDWRGAGHRMEKVNDNGLWTLFVPGMSEGTAYKYEIKTQWGERFMKSDPFAFGAELRPNTASVVTELDGYNWQDSEWMELRKNRKAQDPAPNLIYEVHLGSWKHRNGESLSYRELADELVDYLADMGYTYVEVMPLNEYPLDASWGYQATGYYALTSRYGKPHDFMYFVDRCHQNNIGVLMDWVPGHFCKDAHGLRQFDGAPCFEYADPQRAENEQWGTCNFDLGRTEVQSFLISNALFWMDTYHMDGLRVDAVANMLYRNFGKDEGKWSVNIHGGRENLEAIEFIRKLNEAVFEFYPGAAVMAEESTTWPMITKPTYVGGLGFSDKWNMGWMNDMLKYLSHDPIYRKYHHNQLTFSMTYAFSENFVLPLSHDEVVHGKKSLIDKMPGDYWQKFANLRMFYGYMYGHPGKKLLFMGGEFGQFIEWRFAEGLEWNLLDYEKHKQLQSYVKDLNKLYKQEKSLWQREHDWNGFQWVDCSDFEKSIISFVRMGEEANDFIVVASNFTPAERRNYRIGVPGPAKYREVMNSDWRVYGGTGDFDNNEIATENIRWNNYDYSISINLPPLATIYLKPDGSVDYKFAEEKLVVKMVASTTSELAGEPAVHDEEDNAVETSKLTENNKKVKAKDVEINS